MTAPAKRSADTLSIGRIRRICCPDLLSFARAKIRAAFGRRTRGFVERNGRPRVALLRRLFDRPYEFVGPSGDSLVRGAARPILAV